jgi:hypothetical protein
MDPPRGDGGGVGKPMRVGLLLDGTRVPAWVWRVVRDLRDSEHAEVVAAIVRRPAPRAGTTSGRRRFRHLLYALYSRLDRALFPLSPDPFERVDLTPELEGTTRLEVSPRETRFSDYLEDDDLERLRRLDLDILLRFGFRILRGEILRVPRYGVWSFHHDDSEVIRGGPPGFWEVMEGHPVTGSVLQRLTEELDGGPILYRSWSPTHPRSVWRNRGHVYWKSAAFVRREVEQLAREGESAVSGGAPLPAIYDGRLYRKPGNREMARLLLGFLPRALGVTLDKALLRRQWFLAYRFSPERPWASDLFRFRCLFPPRDRFWADPCPWEAGGEHVVFFEDYSFRSRRGRIAALRLGPEGPRGGPFPVVERPHHLSYPFLFRWRDDLFMAVESARSGAIEVYRCQSFPERWELADTWLEGRGGADPTLHFDGELWWLFVNLQEEGTAHAFDELHLFHAPRPTGVWTAHPANPVRSDCRGARPAGRLERWGGALLRPGQDCGPLYGHAVILHRVERLARTEFAERPVARIGPRWKRGLLGTHTLNRVRDLTVVDGLIRRIHRRRLGKSP